MELAQGQAGSRGAGQIGALLGPGSGGTGGGGGKPPEAGDGKTGNDPAQLSGNQHPGRTIGSFLVEGEAPRGDSRAELKEVLQASRRFAEEAIQHERIPAELRQVVEDYFNRLNERVQGN